MTSETPVSPPTPPPRRRTDEILATLTERLGGSFSATTVFGSPVQRGEVTVIPAAAVGFGLGAGDGADPRDGKSGEGGGGGGGGAPAGYIEIRDGGSRFVPVVHPARIAALCCATVVAVVLILRPKQQRCTGRRRRR